MHAIACQGVEENRQCRHERLALARRHLRDFALMERNSAEDLHVVMDHVPLDFVAARSPFVVVDSLVAVDRDEIIGGVGSQFAVEVSGGYDGLLVLCEAPCGIFYNGESDGHHLVEHLFIFV